MGTTETIIILGLLFYGLGKTADVIVTRVRSMSERMGFSPMLLGILLGVLTTLPEIAIAINAINSDIAAVSFGNLIGGIPVLLGLILGVSLIFNRGVDTRDSQREAPFLAVLLASPVLLGLDGRIGAVDGLVLIGGYIAYLSWLYIRSNGSSNTVHVGIISSKRASHELLEVIIAGIGVILFSDLIVDLTLNLLSGLGMSEFLIGLLIFAIGTNLPEIAIAFRSWQHKAAEVSANHLLGSAASSIPVIGVLGFIRPTEIPGGPANWAFTGLLVTLLVCLVIFIRTDRRLSPREGVVLLGLFLVNIGMQWAFMLS